MDFRDRLKNRSSLKSSQYLDKKKEEKDKKRYPTKKNNNKKWVEFCKEHRNDEGYKDMSYHDFLKVIAVVYKQQKEVQKATDRTLQRVLNSSA